MEEKSEKVFDSKQEHISPGKSHLTVEDLGNIKRLLLEKRAEIMGDVNLMENDALKKTRGDAAGDLSAMPIHMADIGTDNYEQEFALGLVDSERNLLHEVNDALQRIEEGTYGICEGAGEPIAKARLEASPWARYCLTCAGKLEMGHG
jgi:DnaK suppressor protein